MTQKKLSPRQLQWLDVLNEFDFKITYIKGNTNIFADALSQIYSNDGPDSQRALSEYLSPDSIEEEN
ncbi:hypothetical protein NEOLEDRAFT_1023701, partial [Neolentinus lepideus HHB14362 ss-1]